MEQTSILIIDDDMGMLKTMNYILREKGYDVVTMNSGYDALELIKKRPFDIVLTDIKMPEMNGVEVLEQIKKIAPETDVMMITAYTMHELVEEAKKRGVQKIFSKPLNFDTIIPCIDDLKKKKHDEFKHYEHEAGSLLGILEERDRELKEKSLLLDELRRELQDIKNNPAAIYEEDKKRKQTENIENILNSKQLQLFKILSSGEKDYKDILEEAFHNNLDIRDMPALRLQISRLDKKLQQETNLKIDKIRRNKTLYFTIKRTPADRESGV